MTGKYIFYILVSCVCDSNKYLTPGGRWEVFRLLKRDNLFHWIKLAQTGIRAPVNRNKVQYKL